MDSGGVGSGAGSGVDSGLELVPESGLLEEDDDDSSDDAEEDEDDEEEEDWESEEDTEELSEEWAEESSWPEDWESPDPEEESSESLESEAELSWREELSEEEELSGGTSVPLPFHQNPISRVETTRTPTPHRSAFFLAVRFPGRQAAGIFKISPHSYLLYPLSLSKCRKGETGHENGNRLFCRKQCKKTGRKRPFGWEQKQKKVVPEDLFSAGWTAV